MVDTLDSLLLTDVAERVSAPLQPRAVDLSSVRMDSTLLTSALPGKYTTRPKTRRQRAATIHVASVMALSTLNAIRAASFGSSSGTTATGPVDLDDALDVDVDDDLASTPSTTRSISDRIPLMDQALPTQPTAAREEYVVPTVDLSEDEPASEPLSALAEGPESSGGGSGRSVSPQITTGVRGLVLQGLSNVSFGIVERQDDDRVAVTARLGASSRSRAAWDRSGPGVWTRPGTINGRSVTVTAFVQGDNEWFEFDGSAPVVGMRPDQRIVRFRVQGPGVAV